MQRIEASIDEFGGAFLCDVVGSGKTYVGLAIAAKMRNPLIIAPAGLREMWASAMRATESRARFVTAESLSRKPLVLDECDGIIVDEAHHFRNPGAIRHRNLATLVRQRPILFLTATPIHNSRNDLENLASLFLGERARALSDLEWARLIVRRERASVSTSVSLPEVAPTTWLSVSDNTQLTEMLLALPPPVPLKDAGEARALVSHGLIRQWASSDSALSAALSRRISRASALEVSLERGEYPSEQDIRSWILGDDAIQLGLPGLFRAEEHHNCEELVSSIRAHAAALRNVLAALRSGPSHDHERAELLRKLLQTTSEARVVAFGSYEATVLGLFGRLQGAYRVAALTARGGRVASGSIGRSEILRQFAAEAPAPREAERIELLLTTDLLSEGVNLQNAGVVVHLDIPWTSARLDQRVGRVARIGSRHPSVKIFGLRPPASAEAVLQSSSLVTAKWLAATAAIGKTDEHGLSSDRVNSASAPPEIHEAIRGVLSRWLNSEIPRSKFEIPAIAAVNASAPGFIALLESVAAPILLAGNENEVTDSPAAVLDVIAEAGGDDAHLKSLEIRRALQRIMNWISATESALSAGLDELSFLRARSRLLRRLDDIAERTPPQFRSSRECLLAQARVAAISTIGAADEEQLAALSSEDSQSEEEWLRKVAAVRVRDRRPGGSYRIRAVLLLVPTPAPAS